MKIIVDVFGCDESPDEILKGVIEAMNADHGLEPVLSGNADIILPILAALHANMSKIEIIDAREVITNEDSPATALRVKKDSSLVRAVEALKTRDDIAGMISAGSTGAVLSAGVLTLGRLPGVLRPALAAILPTQDNKEVCLVDCGANVDCKPEYLVQFALMGVSYMRAVYNVENPRVGLVSVGTEDKKGNELTKDVFARLKQQPINFLGNMESRDALSGKFDVLVCDGFVGNIFLKSVEGTAKMILAKLKNNIMDSLVAKFGALFMKKAFKQLKTDMDYNAKGGAPLLGVQKPMVKCHGSVKATAIKAALLQTLKMVRGGVTEKIKSEMIQFIV